MMSGRRSAAASADMTMCRSRSASQTRTILRRTREPPVGPVKHAWTRAAKAVGRSLKSGLTSNPPSGKRETSFLKSGSTWNFAEPYREYSSSPGLIRPIVRPNGRPYQKASGRMTPALIEPSPLFVDHTTDPATTRVTGIAKTCALPVFLSVLLFALSSAHALEAAPGDLDTSFGPAQTRKVTPRGPDSASALAAQTDDKIVVGGTSGGP